ncbi:hypothetical protein Taro_051433 [Colocasia esculenta]|uniref:Uncharacterized protein n=1 Tax=Colocasia esculenta TaxID=4460 RepID=A0A843XGT8_COLES|nr:hypothetical protein [Colocasia esculenta]
MFYRLRWGGLPLVLRNHQDFITDLPRLWLPVVIEEQAWPKAMSQLEVHRLQISRHLIRQMYHYHPHHHLWTMEH